MAAHSCSGARGIAAGLPGGRVVHIDSGRVHALRGIGPPRRPHHRLPRRVHDLGLQLPPLPMHALRHHAAPAPAASAVAAPSAGAAARGRPHHPSAAVRLLRLRLRLALPRERHHRRLQSVLRRLNLARALLQRSDAHVTLVHHRRVELAVPAARRARLPGPHRVDVHLALHRLAPHAVRATHTRGHVVKHLHDLKVLVLLGDRASPRRLLPDLA
mmetsp:Transcript_7968/g.20584  ORF Transcript_7968/g.20584 Transcript_7968/m.20584 type:complete len:215 (+) Transcript_7968:472-1116(+)